MTTLSLEASKKVFEIVGEYETEKCWEGLLIDVGDKFRWRVNKRNKNGNPAKYPAPNLAELIRVLPNIGEKTDLKNIVRMCSEIANAYMTYSHFGSEPEGMKAVETYLMKLL